MRGKHAAALKQASQSQLTAAQTRLMTGDLHPRIYR